jgi:hypothetical protein
MKRHGKEYSKPCPPTFTDRSRRDRLPPPPLIFVWAAAIRRDQIQKKFALQNLETIKTLKRRALPKPTFHSDAAFDSFLEAFLGASMGAFFLTSLVKRIFSEPPSLWSYTNAASALSFDQYLKGQSGVVCKRH